MAAKWFEDEIRDGLASLLVLRIPGTPAGDTMGAVCSTWVACLSAGRWYSQQRDTNRIRAGFLRLAGSITQWPAPRALLDAMPGVPPQRYLPKPAPNPAVAEKHIAAIADLLGVAPREPEPPQDPDTVPPEAPPPPEYMRAVEADLRRHYHDRKRAASGEREDENE